MYSRIGASIIAKNAAISGSSAGRLRWSACRRATTAPADDGGAVQWQQLARERCVELRRCRRIPRGGTSIVGAHQPPVVVQLRVTADRRARAARSRARRSAVDRPEARASSSSHESQRLLAPRRCAAAPARDCARAGSESGARATRRAQVAAAPPSGRSSPSNNTPIEVRNAAESGASRESVL